jgi:hypothetical protein
VTRVNLETERVTHCVLKLIYDSIASSLDSQCAANLHDVVASDARAFHAASRHDLAQTPALNISAKRVSSNGQARDGVHSQLVDVASSSFF